MSRELDFERPVLELERQIAELRRIAAGRDNLASVVASQEMESEPPPPMGGHPVVEATDEALEHRIAELEDRARTLQTEVFGALSRWQVVQLSRHPERPYTLDYVAQFCTDFIELHGDRAFGDDGAIVGGFARLDGEPIMVIGHQKGRTTKENLRRNFGMARPEGYRKAMRLMGLADRFGMPIITLIDTPGAYPGLGAEERGQARAIAESLEFMANVGVPIISIVIGEGGSGGALAIGVGNRVSMLEHATYSVISPEACSSILFKDAAHAEKAADALKLTAPDLMALGVIDAIIPEPAGGAHRDPELAAARVVATIKRQLTEMSKLKSRDALRRDRYDRFRRLGQFVGPTAPSAAESTGGIQ